MKPLAISEQERATLIAIAVSTNNAVELRRAQALLWLDEGESVEEVAERLMVSRQTIYNWISQFQTRQQVDISQRLTDADRSGRPKTAKGVIDPLINQIIDTDPRQYGYHSTIWTTVLLKQYLADYHQLTVSQRSIGAAIERLNIHWKRPRHQLALRPETWRQAKGGSKEG
jgi:transposase